MAVRREQFEAMTADLLQRTADTTELVLDQAGIKASQLDALVMVGGSTRMPQVPRRIEGLIGLQAYKGHLAFYGGGPRRRHSRRHSRGSAPRRFQRPSRKGPQDARHDRTGERQFARPGHRGDGPGDDQSTAESRDDPAQTPRLPIEVKRIFRTNHEGQKKITVRVLEGDAPDPAACSRLGKCRVTDLPPGLPVRSKVEVTYAFDPAGRISVRAKELTGGTESAVEIERRGRLDERQIDAYARLASEYSVE